MMRNVNPCDEEPETCTLLITDAVVVTMGPERTVHDPGYVAVDGDRIVAVGPQEACAHRGIRTISAAGRAVLPGFVNAHTHSLDILLRGGLCDDRTLYDWLTNVVDPGCAAYRREDITTAVELYALEALRSGITTVVDSMEAAPADWDEVAGDALEVYERAGLRTVYALMFYDAIAPETLRLLEANDQRPPERRTDFGALGDLDTALAGIEAVMARHHGSAEGRISIWPSPGVAILCSPEAFAGAQALARRWGVMTTVHVCESPADATQEGLSGVTYLDRIGYLGPDVLAGHCVQISTNDIRTLARTGTKVASNPVSNMYLGNGIAPVAELRTAGVDVGLGTDDANCNGTVNMLGDLKFAALAQKARYRDPAAITAEEVLELATIGGAAAIGMAEEIGSLEVGKKADLAIIDLTASHLVPRQVPWLDATTESELAARAQAASDRIAAAAHLPTRDDAHWRSSAGRL